MRAGKTEACKAPKNIWACIVPKFAEPSGEPDTMEIIKTVRNGLPGDVITKVANAYQIQKKDMFNILHLTPKTGQRTVHRKKLTTEKSDHLVRLVKVYERATDVFGCRENAFRWVKTPCLAMGGEVPFNLLDTTEGADLVMDILGRIEHGIPA